MYISPKCGQPVQQDGESVTLPVFQLQDKYYSVEHGGGNELKWNWLGVMQSNFRPVYVIGFGDIDLVNYEASSSLAYGGSSRRGSNVSTSLPMQTVRTLLQRFEDKQGDERILFVGPGWCLEIASYPCQCCFGVIRQFALSKTNREDHERTNDMDGSDQSIWIIDDFDSDGHLKVKSTMKKLLDLDETEHNGIKEATNVYYEGVGDPAEPPQIFFLLSYPCLAGSYICVLYGLMDLDQAYPIAAVASTILAYEGLELSSIAGVALLGITNVFPSVMAPYFGVGPVQETVIYVMVATAVASLLVVLLKDELSLKRRFVLVPKSGCSYRGTKSKMDFVFHYNQIAFHEGMHCRLSSRRPLPDYLPPSLQSRCAGLFSTIGLVGIDGAAFLQKTIAWDQKIVDSEAEQDLVHPLLRFEKERIWLCSCFYELFWLTLTMLVLAVRYIGACVALVCVFIYAIHNVIFLAVDLVFVTFLYVQVGVYLIYRSVKALCLFRCSSDYGSALDCVVHTNKEHSLISPEDAQEDEQRGCGCSCAETCPETILLNCIAPSCGWVMVALLFSCAFLLTFTTQIIICTSVAITSAMHLVVWCLRYYVLRSIAEMTGVHFIYDLNHEQDVGWYGMLTRILSGPFTVADVKPKLKRTDAGVSSEAVDADMHTSPCGPKEDHLEPKESRGRRRFLGYGFGTYSTRVRVHQSLWTCRECESHFCAKHKGENWSLMDGRAEDFEDEKHVDDISVNLRLRARVKHNRSKRDGGSNWVKYLLEFDAERFYFLSSIPRLFHEVMNFNGRLWHCVKFKTLVHTEDYTVHARV